MPETAGRSSEHTDSTSDIMQTSRRRVWILSVLALAAGVGTTIVLQRARYESFNGFLQAKLRTINAPRDAKIAKVFVREGTMVEAGQPLVALEADDLEARLTKKRTELAGLEAELLQSEARLTVELEARQGAIQAEIFETKLRSAQFLRQQFSQQVENLAWGEFGHGAETTLFANATPRDEPLKSIIFENRKPDEERIRALLRQEAAQNANEVSSAQIELCDERLKQLELQSRELPDKLRRSMGTDRVQPLVELARSELAALEEEKQSLTITAQGPGIVGVFQKRLGDHVVAHEAIVQILDEEQPYLMLRIPSQRIADFATDSIVELCFPGGRLGKGRVEEIPPQTAPISVTTGTDESLLIVQVIPVGVQWPRVPFGSQVEVRRMR